MIGSTGCNTMLIKKYTQLLRPVFIIATFVFSSIGDIIHLKSGGMVEGSIVSEESGSVVIDVGFGTTSVDTADIASIERSGSYKQGKQKTDQSVPPILKPFVEGMHNLRALRFKAVDRKRELEDLNRKIDSLEEALEEVAGDYVTLSEDLRKVREGEVYVWREERYLINKAHGYNAAILDCQQKLKEKNNDKRFGNPALNKYLDSLAKVDLAFTKLIKSSSAKKLNELQPALSEIGNDLKQFRAEFEVAAVDVTFIGHNHILVPVKINGRKPVKLILDTGASSVVLSRSLATRLGINWSTGKEIEVILANGEKAKGNLVILRSVSVEEFRADNVRATVMEKAQAPGIEGLLGMSYLDRFMMRIDAVNKKLVLNDFRGR